MSSNDPSECCQVNYQDLEGSTLPDSRLLTLWSRVKNNVMYMGVLGPRIAIPRVVRSTKLGRSILEGESRPSYSNPSGSLGLRPGEWVRVRTAKEIFSTLDGSGKLRGLGVAPEMMQFCGRQFQVFKVVEKICLEHTGEIRRVRTPTVILEGVFCDGSAHGGCDRSQFFFWREDWLERLPQAKVSR